MNQIKDFEDLEVWKQGHKLVLKVYQVTRNFPVEERFGLVSQIRRSAASICANIAEGFRKSTKDYIRFLDIAQGSLQETKYHLILSKDLQYCDSAEIAEMISLTNQVGKMLSSLTRSLRSREFFNP